MKFHNPNIRVVVRSADHSSETRFPLFKGDTVFHSAEVKNAVSATNLVIPGATHLVSSLFTNISDDDYPSDLEEGSWEQQCAEGMGQEVYLFPAPSSLVGMSFGEAAAAIYDDFGAILIAAEVPLKSSDGPAPYLLLNPAKGWTIFEKCTLYALATDASFLSKILKEEVWNPIAVIQNIQGGLAALPGEMDLPAISFAERVESQDEERGRRREWRRRMEEGGEGDVIVDGKEEEEEEELFVPDDDDYEDEEPSLYDAVVKGVPSDWGLVYSIVRTEEEVRGGEGERESWLIILFSYFFFPPSLSSSLLLSRTFSSRTSSPNCRCSTTSSILVHSHSHSSPHPSPLPPLPPLLHTPSP